jgi:hypothetical protein
VGHMMYPSRSDVDTSVMIHPWGLTIVLGHHDKRYLREVISRLHPTFPSRGVQGWRKCPYSQSGCLKPVKRHQLQPQRADLLCRRQSVRDGSEHTLTG